MVFFSRSPRGRDRWLLVKGVTLILGIALVLLSITFERSWMVWSAIAVVFVGWALRFAPKGEEE